MFARWKRRWKRWLVYFLDRGWWYGLLSPLRLLIWLALFRYSEASVGGIRLVSMEDDIEQADTFARVTHDALKLIRLHDPRRFRRLQRHAKFIINERLDSSAEWFQTMRECKVDFSRYKVGRSRENYLWNLAWYASVLVHEATHARIIAHLIPYSKALRARTEHLCWREQQRFLQRLPRDQYDFARMMPPFDEADWLPAWNMTPAENRRRKLQRIKEILQSKRSAK